MKPTRSPLAQSAVAYEKSSGSIACSSTIAHIPAPCDDDQDGGGESGVDGASAVKSSAHLVSDCFGDLILEESDGLQRAKTFELCNGDERDSDACDKWMHVVIGADV